MAESELDLKIEIGVLEADIKVTKQRIAETQEDWVRVSDKLDEEKRVLASLEGKLSSLQAPA